MLNWIVWNRTVCMYKNWCSINNLLWLIYHKTIPNQFFLYKNPIWRCPWCNSYRRRKWTRRLGFKSWTRIIAFHIALIPFGKVWIQLFSLQLWVNSRADWFLLPWFFSLGERNSEFKPVKLRLKIDLVSYPTRTEGLVNMIIKIKSTLQYVEYISVQ